MTAKAYSAVHDIVSNVAKQAPKFPNSNFTDVIPAQLSKSKFHSLILQAGSVDITNLQTTENPSNYMEYFKQEAIISANNLFTAAVNSLSTQPSLEKVVIMKQIPRYDPADVDPLSLKQVLSQLFNTTLSTLWMNCPLKNKIVIGSHNIECSGARKESRYREPITGRFDGIHMRGNSGRKFYTLSVLNILKAAKLTSSDHDYHKSCAQYQYQARQHYGGQNVYTQVRNTGRNVYRQNMNNKYNCDNVPNQQPIHFSIPTKNRFEQFSKNC